MPKLIESKKKISSRIELSNAIDYFTKNFETISYKEKGILYRVLALIDNNSCSKILNSLEDELYNNIDKHDLNDILNYLNGVKSIHSTNNHFYAQTADHVKRKLRSDIRFLFLDLKVIKLSNNVSDSNESKSLENLVNVFKYLKVIFEI